jgi:formamidopyrimidine-DNA glycosylase
VPELPEVEAARRGISEQLLGKLITGIELRLPKLIIDPFGIGLSALGGRHIETLERRGKYLALTLDDLVAVVHLKLSGQLVGRGPVITGFAAGHPVPHFETELPHKSTHLILKFDDDSLLYLTDIRHFARVQLLPAEELPEYWRILRLGPDAISTGFSRAWFHEAIGRRKLARLKPLLLDQSFLAGLGNIYVDESLWLARLHPERLAPTLTAEEIDRLYDAIVAVLEIAVPIGGAKILNGKALPEHGEFPLIHGREGAPCLRCGTSIIKTRVNNRGTYLCPQCQQL